VRNIKSRVPTEGFSVSLFSLKLFENVTAFQFFETQCALMVLCVYAVDWWDRNDPAS